VGDSVLIEGRSGADENTLWDAWDGG